MGVHTVELFRDFEQEVLRALIWSCLLRTGDRLLFQQMDLGCPLALCGESVSVASLLGRAYPVICFFSGETLEEASAASQ